MIPLSAKGFVEHKDEDGIVWRFKPKCGDTEDTLLAYISNKENIPMEQSVKNAREFIDAILISWSDPEAKGMVAFPTDGKPSRIFTAEERITIMTYWNKANGLSGEEKKT